jgi:AbiU2
MNVRPDRIKKTNAEQIAHISQKLMSAQVRFDLWEGFMEARESFDSVEVMNRYPQFFTSTWNALFESSIVSLWAIYEIRNDTINISQLLSTLKSEEILDDGQTLKYQACCKEIKPIWIKLGILRNEIYAHQSLDSYDFMSLEKASITPTEIREFIDKSKSMIGHISSDSGCGVLMFNLKAKSDLNALLNNLAEHHQREFQNLR